MERGPGEADYHQAVQSSYKLGEILANAITHGIGALLAVAGAAYLIAASTRGTARVVVSCSVFAGTLVLVYVCSTLYHSLVRTRARHVFHVLDHSSIYLLIAGTYTPFTLVSLRGPLGWSIFGVEWALAAAGVVFKSLAVDRFAVASALVYLFQGWFVVIAVRPLVSAIGWHGIAGWARADWPIRWASCSLPWTGCATSMRPGTCLCWPAAWPTTLPFFSTWFQRGRDRGLG